MQLELTVPELDVELEYAGFWPRVRAALIDTVLLMLITFPLVTAIYGWSYWQNEAMIAGPADFLISYVLPAVITLALWTKLAATPGKMAIRATIVDARTGGAPSTGQFVVRYLGYFIAAIPLLLGILWVALDPRRQGWHDKLAGTVVVRRKDGATAPVRFEDRTG